MEKIIAVSRPQQMRLRLCRRIRGRQKKLSIAC